MGMAVLSLPRLAGPDTARGLQSVHDGHLNIHEDQVEALLLQRFQDAATVRDGVCPVSEPLEQAGHGHLRYLVVFCEQKVQAGKGLVPGLLWY